MTKNMGRLELAILNDVFASVASNFLESFRLYDEKEYEISLPVFSKNTWEIYNTRLILHFVSSVDCSVILVAGSWALLQIEKWQNHYRVLDLFWPDNIFAKPRTKMTTVSRFSRQNDVGLRAQCFSMRKSPFSSPEPLVLRLKMSLRERVGFFSEHVTKRNGASGDENGKSRTLRCFRPRI